jgi:hypothetical protein
MEVATVTRKKSGVADPTRKPVALNIKGDPAWRDWVERAAAHSRMSVSAYIDVALAKLAKQEGFEPKPPERLP